MWVQISFALHAFVRQTDGHKLTDGPWQYRALHYMALIEQMGLHLMQKVRLIFN